MGALSTRLALRLERRGLQLRAWAAARALVPVTDRTGAMPPGPILVTVLRNEAARLPWFLDHYRRLGVVHVLAIDNGSDDGGPAWLAAQPDVSLWSTTASYKAARFGVDWINGLLARHAVGRWVVVVDPDELLIYPHHDSRDLGALTRWLERSGAQSFGALLLDLYGDRPIRETVCGPGEDPVAAAPWFDALAYMVERDAKYHNLWVQGGPRLRAFFADRPRAAPALNKIPLVRWAPGMVYRTGAHDMLPRRLNRVYGHGGGTRTSGVLLHTKFLSTLGPKVAEELTRREHYAGSREYEGYAAAGDGVCLWTPHSTRFRDWRQLRDLGLMAQGGWL